MATTAAATGRLMKNTKRQDAALIPISHPPRKGPTAVARPPSPDQAPIALERSSATKEACKIARLPGRQQRGPDPLQSAGQDQRGRVRGQPAQ